MVPSENTYKRLPVLFYHKGRDTLCEAYPTDANIQHVTVVENLLSISCFTQFMDNLQITVYDTGGQNLTDFAEKVRSASAAPPWNLNSTVEVRLMATQKTIIIPATSSNAIERIINELILDNIC